LLDSQRKLGTQLPLKTEIDNKSYSALQDLNELENATWFLKKKKTF